MKLLPNQMDSLLFASMDCKIQLKIQCTSIVSHIQVLHIKVGNAASAFTLITNIIAKRRVARDKQSYQYELSMKGTFNKCRC